MINMDLDEVYNRIGEWGKHQKFLCFLMFLGQSMTALHMILMVFVGDIPNFYCTNSQTGFKHFRLNETTKQACANYYERKCDTFIFVSDWLTLSQEMNLVCDQAYKAGFSQSVFMSGILVGSLVFGVVSDAVGRLKTVYCTVTIMVICSSLLGFVSTFNQFLILRFILGFGMAGHGLATYVLGSELIGGKKRGFFAVCFSIFFAFGICLLVVLALLVDNWRNLSHCVSLVTLLIALLYLKLPESPRWLISQGKATEAKHVIERIARGNGTQEVAGGYELKLPPELISEQKPGETKSVNSEGIGVILRNWTAFLWTSIMAYSWFANSAVYYGLTMAAGNLSRNLYASVLLSGVAELPAYLFVNFVHSKIGRRTLIAGTMIMGGVACMWILFVGSGDSSTNYRTVLALIGKVGISASFTAIYVHTGEVFPTVMRNAGLGLCGMAARVGGVVAPAILVVGTYYPAKEFLIFGLVGFTSGLLNLYLPETLGKPLPETVSDMLNLDVKKIVRTGTRRNPEIRHNVV